MGWVRVSRLPYLALVLLSLFLLFLYIPQRREPDHAGITIGIEIGGSYSRFAVFPKGSDVKPLSNEQHVMTSCVSFHENSKSAIFENGILSLSTADPGLTTICAKDVLRVVTKREDQSENTVPNVVYIDEKPIFRVNINGKMTKLSPENVFGMIVKELKSTAESLTGQKVADAVITVPSGLNDEQRQFIKSVGSNVDMNILRIVNDPTAAAIAHGLDKIDAERYVLVYDFGGNTLDVSLLLVDEGVFEIIATDRLELGGNDLNQKVLDYLLQRFPKAVRSKIENDQTTTGKLELEIEKAKRILSSETSAQIDLVIQDYHVVEILTRAEFEDVTKDLLVQGIDSIAKVLAASKIQISEIHHLLLTGGSSHIPRIRQLVEQYVNVVASEGVEPEEAAVHGAAIYASVLSSDDDICTLHFEINPLALGIEVVGGQMSAVIPRWSVLPTRKTKLFTTVKDDQSVIVLQIFEGNRLFAEDNFLLGRLELKGIPAAPKGVPELEIMFEMDSNYQLKVSAIETLSGRSNDIKINVDISRLTMEEIEEMVFAAEIEAGEEKHFRFRDQFDDYSVTELGIDGTIVHQDL